MNEVVKYDNYMNSLNFSKFNKIDMNIFLTLCNRMKDKNTQKISLNFELLRELTNYKKSNSIDQFANDLEKMNEKLMRVTCKLRTQTETIMFVLFPTFKINRDKQLLTVSVNEEFRFILNELVKNFTRFDLKEFIELDSKYSKTLYRLLKQYRTTGKYEVSIEDFRGKMDCPKSYSNKYVMDLVIKPSLKELKEKEYFLNLKCEPKYACKRGKPVIGYIFTFTPENRGSQLDQDQEHKDKKRNNKNAANGFANFHQRKYDYAQLEREIISQPKSDDGQSDNEYIESQMRNMLDEMKK